MISIPPPPAARLYVADFNNGVVAFSQPVMSTSTPLFTLIGSAANPSAVVVDSAGNLYVAHYNVPNIDVYHQPITAASTPAFTMNVAIGNISGLSMDKSGNLWGASESSAEVFEIAPPFAGGPVTPLYFTSASFNGPVDVVFNSSGQMLVPEFNGKSLLAFTPPFAFPGPNVPAATIALLNNVGGVHNPDQGAGCAIDLHDHLIIGLNTSGQLAIFNPPFATGNTAAGWVAPPTINGGPSGEPLHSTFDPSGNLWVPYGQFGGANAGVVEYGPPFTSSSVPTVILAAGASSGLSWPFGLAFGP
ncbi:MAG: hypothetical protein JO194_01070 [Candidatus Eremiobacteraeota bacterium]|nr:hypothetical protein [Candidatus Eremiobacteraeota bacterium]